MYRRDRAGKYPGFTGRSPVGVQDADQASLIDLSWVRRMKYVKNTAKILIVTALVVLALCALSRVLQNKSSRFNKQPLYDLGISPDVIFVGASRIHNAIYPARLWEKYGIAAYNCASPGEQTGTTYYVLRQLLDDVSPKLVVFDLGLVSDTDEVSWSHEIGYIHESMDFMPLNKNKIELAKNVADYNEMSPLAFLSHITFYHDRWKELSGDDFKEKYSRELGAEILTRIVSKEAPEIYEPVEAPEALEGAGFEWLEKMMALCDEKGVSYMFINLPYATDNERRQSYEYTYMQEARRRGGYALDLLRSMEESGLSFETDFADSGHVNLMGAVKLTDQLGQYLAGDELSSIVPDRRGEEAYQIWDKACEDYGYFRAEQADSAENAAAFAMYAYAWPEVSLKVYEGEAGNLSRDENALMAVGAAGGEVLAEDEMTEEEKTVMADKYDGADKINKNRMALFLEDRETGKILAMGLYTYKNEYVPDR